MSKFSIPTSHGRPPQAPIQLGRADNDSKLQKSIATRRMSLGMALPKIVSITPPKMFDLLMIIGVPPDYISPDDDSSNNKNNHFHHHNKNIKKEATSMTKSSARLLSMYPSTQSKRSESEISHIINFCFPTSPESSRRIESITTQNSGHSLFSEESTTNNIISGFNYFSGNSNNNNGSNSGNSNTNNNSNNNANNNGNNSTNTKTDVILNEFCFYLSSCETERTYGVCVQFRVPPDCQPFFCSMKNKRYPFALCMLTSQPYLSTHFNFLSFLALALCGKAKLPPTLGVMTPIPVNGFCHPSLTLDKSNPLIAVYPSSESGGVKSGENSNENHVNFNNPNGNIDSNNNDNSNTTTSNSSNSNNSDNNGNNNSIHRSSSYSITSVNNTSINNNNINKNNNINNNCATITPSALVPHLNAYYMQTVERQKDPLVLTSFCPFVPCVIPLQLSANECLLTVSLDVLFSHLSTDLIVYLYSAMMLEQRILFISKDPHKYSLAVIALTSLMSPFNIHSTILPVIPNYEDFLPLLESPVPYIAGSCKISGEPDIIADLDKGILLHKNIEIDGKTVENNGKNLAIPKIPRASDLIRKINMLIQHRSFEITVPPPEIKFFFGKTERNPEYIKFFQKTNYYVFPKIYTIKNFQKYIFVKALVDSIKELFETHLAIGLTDKVMMFFVTDSTDNMNPITILNKELFIDSLIGSEKSFFSLFIQTQAFQDFTDNMLEENDKTKRRLQRSVSTNLCGKSVFEALNVEEKCRTTDSD